MRALEAAMRARIGQDCLYVPSARFGLLIALRHWFAPGDRVMIAPTNCETVLAVVLHAGLTPVLGPVSAADGNLDVPLIRWDGLSGVITTNLYGQPDDTAALRRECRDHGLVLLDDAAHAYLTDGAGLAGEAGVFSLAKHGRAGSGGFVTCADPAALAALSTARGELLLGGDLRGRIGQAVRPVLRDLAHRTGLAGPLWRLLGHSRRGHRTADGLSADLPGWRTAHGVVLRGQRLARMRMIERERERRLAGVGLLSRTRWAAPGVREAPVRPLLRVPLLVQRRDEVVARLARHGVLTGFLYDPPLGDYLPGLEPGPTPEVARHWCAHVLPVDPLRAATVIALLGAWGVIGAG